MNEDRLELVKAHERLDDLHRAGLFIIQDKSMFCFGQDAVLLSSFAVVKKGESALDLGSGTGIIPILLAGKTAGDFFHGLEIQPDSVEMSRRSVLFNDLTERIKITEGDIKNADKLYPLASFDVITSNPPYITNTGGLKNSDIRKTIARHEVLCSLEDVTHAAAKLLRPGGRFYMVHRPHRLTDIMCSLRANRLEPKTLRFVHPHAGDEPEMVLAEAIRGTKPMLKVLPPLIIMESDGSYTRETFGIYYE